MHQIDSLTDTRVGLGRNSGPVAAVADVLSNISLPRQHIPVGVADIRVPNYWVHTKITDLHDMAPLGGH